MKLSHRYGDSLHILLYLLYDCVMWTFDFLYCFYYYYDSIKIKYGNKVNILIYLKAGEIPLWVINIFLFTYSTYKNTGKICYSSEYD